MGDTRLKEGVSGLMAAGILLSASGYVSFPDLQLAAMQRPAEPVPPACAEPDWPKAVGGPYWGGELDGVHELRGKTSIWRDGSVPAYDCAQWNPLFVWSAGPGSDGHSVIGLTLLNAPPEQGRDYNGAVWVCPCDGTIVGTSASGGPGGTVGFRTSAGQSGTLDLRTGTWTFDQRSAS